MRLDRLRRAAVGFALAGLAATSIAPAAVPKEAAAPVSAAHTLNDARAGGGTWELTSSSGSEKPVRWLACRPIQFRINPKAMPNGMASVVKRVMRTIGKQTGARFHYAGTTKHAFGSSSYAGKPTIYFAFTGADGVAGQTFAWPGQIGVGGPAAAWTTMPQGSTYEAITYGRVLLSTKFQARRIGPGVTWESLILHETGHALNLDHRASASAVMHASLTPRSPARFTAGEVKALKRALQTRGCDYAAWERL